MMGPDEESKGNIHFADDERDAGLTSRTNQYLTGGNNYEDAEARPSKVGLEIKDKSHDMDESSIKLPRQSAHIEVGPSG